MGYKYEISAWERADGSNHWYWLQIYSGDSIIKAIYYLIWSRRQGWCCVKFEWR